MSLLGYLLLLSGWLLVFVSLFLLASIGQRFAFVVAGLLVEFLGLALVGFRYRSLQKGAE